MTKDELDEAIKKAKAFIESPEGRKSLREASRAAEETVRKLQEARKVDWRELHRPFDI